MAQLIGTAPNQVPTNADLGIMAFQDPAGVNITGGIATATHSAPDIIAYQLVANSYPSISPALMLDFANSKALDPRITFARTSTATYYDGVTTAVAEQNLFKYSQQLDVATTGWSSFNITAVGNSATAPDGTTTATSFTEDTSVASHRFSNNQAGNSINTVSGTVYTFSMYLKYSTRQYVQCNCTAMLTTCRVIFDIQNGLLTDQSTASSASITSVGSGWYRLVVTFTANFTTAGGNIFIGGNSTSTGNGESYTGSGLLAFYAWGAQLEQRASVTAYTPTTTAPITNYIPVLLTAAANVARFDSNPTTSESLGLLIEEQRTNLLTYSSDYTQSAWNKSGATIITAAAVSPDGTQNMQLLVESAATSGHYIFQQNFSGAASTYYTASAYVKYSGRQYIQVNMTDTVTGAPSCTFDLVNGVIYIAAAVTGNWANPSATITPVGNGVYRVTVTGQKTAAGNNIIQPTYSLSNGTSTTYLGNGYSGVFIWGAQLEAGAFATSYIPTVASPLPRAADSASMTGTNFSSWYNQSQGSLYSEFDKLSPLRDATVATIYGGNNTSAIEMNSLTTGLLNFTLRQPSGTFSNPIGLVSSALTGKVVVSFGANIATPYVGTGAINGVYGVFGTGAYIPNPTLNSLYLGYRVTFGDQYVNGHIKRITYYPVALTAAQLQALTS